MKEIQEQFDLPDKCPIPGAIYRRKLDDGRWVFATVIALEVLPRDRWAALFCSVQFGDERITSEINKLNKWELHSVPNTQPVLDTTPTLGSVKLSTGREPVGVDELDMLLAVGA